MEALRARTLSIEYGVFLKTDFACKIQVKSKTNVGPIRVITSPPVAHSLQASLKEGG